MVVGISICFRPRGLSAGCVRVRHRGGLVRKGIDRRRHVVASKQVALHPLHLTPLYVVIISRVDFVAAPQDCHHAARKRAFPIARSVTDELPGGEARTAHEAVAVVMVLHVYHCVGRGILPGAFPLLGQPAEISLKTHNKKPLAYYAFVYKEFLLRSSTKSIARQNIHFKSYLSKLRYSFFICSHSCRSFTFLVVSESYRPHFS